jgi:hypothetical protein
VELFVGQDSVLSGASHLIYRFGHYEHYALKGIFRASDSTVDFVEDSVLGLNLGPLSSNCPGRYRMKARWTDSSIRLEGRWTDHSGEFLGCPPSGVWLEKKLVQKKEAPVPSCTNRAVSLQSLIEIDPKDRDSIQIAIYDNAEVDGDVISVCMDDRSMIYKQKISATPLVFYCSLREDHPISIIHMVAESMGATPPCTASMVISAGGKQHRIALSSSYSSTAAVELFLKH